MAGRGAAVEQTARRLRDELRTGRQGTFTTSDSQFRRDVMIRLHQLLLGEELPREENLDD